jgi:hypothetical protein
MPELFVLTPMDAPVEEIVTVEETAVVEETGAGAEEAKA